MLFFILWNYVDPIIPIRIESNDVFSENGSCQLKIQPLPCLQASPDARSSTPTFWSILLTDYQWTEMIPRMFLLRGESELILLNFQDPVIAFLQWAFWIQTQKVIDACTRILETCSRIGFLQLFSPPDLLINGIPCLTSPPVFDLYQTRGFN